MSPSVQTTSTSVSSALNTPATLFCVVSGFPLPSISWLKNGTLVTADPNITITTISATSPQGSGLLKQLNTSFTGDAGVIAVLQFTSLRRNNNGTYVCRASTTLGQAGAFSISSNEISLTVLGKGKLSDVYVHNYMT